VDLRRTRFVTAQLGRKAGKREALAPLLSGRDLPGGSWHVVDERTWRTGVTGPSTPWGERARQMGSVTAWRSFRDTASSRWAWLQLTPLASAQDAGEALAGVSDRGLANLGARVRLVSESDVPIEPFPAASAVWAREQHTDGRDGPGLVLMLAAAVGGWLMVMCLSGSPDWDWQSAAELAEVQAERLSAR
jgi:hypothetical protein